MDHNVSGLVEAIELLENVPCFEAETETVRQCLGPPRLQTIQCFAWATFASLIVEQALPGTGYEGSSLLRKLAMKASY